MNNRTDNRLAPPACGQKRLLGHSLRRIATITLFTWLFVLATCTFENIASAVTDAAHGHATASPHTHPDEHANPGTPEAPAGDCCDTLQSIPTLSSSADMPIPLQHYFVLSLGLITVLWHAVFAPASISLRTIRPPGLRNKLLLSGSVWPNAPPL